MKSRIEFLEEIKTKSNEAYKAQKDSESRNMKCSDCTLRDQSIETQKKIAELLGVE